MAIMPTKKPVFKWLVREYNYKTGEHAVKHECNSKEEAHFKTIEENKNAKENELPFNYTYDKIQAVRPNLKHERLMEVKINEL